MRLRYSYGNLIRFEASEVRAVIVMAVVFAFALTFRMWGAGESFVLEDGLLNWIIVTAGLIVGFFLHEGGHKFFGALKGVETHIRSYPEGFTISPLIAFFSYGYFPFIIPNVLETEIRTDRTMSAYFKYDAPVLGAYAAFGGLFGSCVAITLFKVLAEVAPHPLFNTIVLGLVLHSIYGLIPFEMLALVKLQVFTRGIKYSPSDGLTIFWWSYQWYIITLATMIIYGFFALFTSTPFFVISLIGGVVVFGIVKLFTR